MRPLNVLWATDRIGYGSHLHGPGRRLLTIAPEIDPAVARLVVCVLRGEDPALSRLFAQRGIPLRHLGRRRLDPTTLPRLVRLVREERIDLLHLTGWGASDFGRLVSAWTGVPAIVHVTDHYHPWYQDVADRLLGWRTDAVIAVSRSVAETSPMFRHARLRRRVRVLQNPVDLREFAPVPEAEAAALRQALGVPPGRLVVGYLGRLHPEKGVHHLPDALPAVVRAVPEAVLVVIGDGPQQRALEAQVQRLGLGPHVLFHGFRSDVAAALSAFDVAVVPSLTEGFPNVVLEAMAVGRPIVASRVEGIAEILRHDETGWLVPPGDAPGLADALVRALKEPAERARLATGAREAAKRFDLRAYVRALEATWGEIARGSAPR